MNTVVTTISHRLLNGIILGSSTGVAIAHWIEKYNYAVTLSVFFVISAIIKLAKARQEYRHREEKHRLEMQSQHDKDLKNLLEK